MLPRQLIELRLNALTQKVYHMNNFIAGLSLAKARLTCILSTSILAASLFCVNANADELTEISQMADNGQVGTAIDRINIFIAANPKNAQGLFLKGVLLTEQGSRDEAIKVFTETTEKFPNLSEPYNNLAVLYSDQGQFDKAKIALETAIKNHPNYAAAHENLGDVYIHLAAESYAKALQLDAWNNRTQAKLSLIKSLFNNEKSVNAENKK